MDYPHFGMSWDEVVTAAKKYKGEVSSSDDKYAFIEFASIEEALEFEYFCFDNNVAYTDFGDKLRFSWRNFK